MTNTRRILILLVVLTLPLWAATGATGKPDGGKPCDTPPCKDEPPPDSGSVEIMIEPSVPWTQEASDIVVYEISVTKPAGTTVVVTSSIGGVIGTLGPSDSDPLRQQYVVAPHYVGLVFGGAPGTLTNIVTAATEAGEVLASASAGVELHYELEPCGLVPGVPTPIPGVCIWTPTDHGDWTVSVLPDANRPTNVQITLRDHVPGNWCPSGIRAKWRPGEEPVTTTFTIPDWEVPGYRLGDQVCPFLDAGDGLWGVGTPSSFFLAVSGMVTVTQGG